MSNLKSPKDTIFCKKRLLNVRGKLVNIDHPLVMGILNVTPDSFFDGGQYQQMEAALKRTNEMLAEGADIIDIGATSTRPGAKISDPKDEINTLLPVLKSIREKFPDSIISVDTYHSEVARAVAGAGADMINDISGGTFDNEMPRTMGALQLPYILMHTTDIPERMQENPQYEDVIKEVIYFLSVQMAKFLEQNVNDIILDPGFGFGKNLEHNYKLLNHLDLFKIFERPLLIGVSRKSLVTRLLNVKPADALNGTIALNTMALQNGADILRVHDVKAAVEAVKITHFAHQAG